MKYQLQVEKDIETLKRDLPKLFEKDISYEIYTRDIYFQDPVNRFQGKLNYRIIFWTLRFHAQLFFTKIYFDLHNVSQSDEDTILAEWTVRGVLRVPWKAGVFFNGYSTYKLNEQGFIYEHIDTWDRKPGEILQQFFHKQGNIRNSNSKNKNNYIKLPKLLLLKFLTSFKKNDNFLLIHFIFLKAILKSS